MFHGKRKKRGLSGSGSSSANGAKPFKFAQDDYVNDNRLMKDDMEAICASESPGGQSEIVYQPAAAPGNQYTYLYIYI
tara:strand:+ start:189 stop:422 length:234 start_codon:yes stop_codon:yes gene_type:complete